MILVGGLALEAKEVGGALIRLPCVFDHDLVHIVPADRADITEEMNAFLRGQLECWQQRTKGG